MNWFDVDASWYIPGSVFGNAECCLDILLICFGQTRMIGMEIFLKKQQRIA